MMMQLLDQVLGRTPPLEAAAAGQEVAERRAVYAERNRELDAAADGLLLEAEEALARLKSVADKLAAIRQERQSWGVKMPTRHQLVGLDVGAIFAMSQNVSHALNASACGDPRGAAHQREQEAERAANLKTLAERAKQKPEVLKRKTGETLDSWRERQGRAAADLAEIERSRREDELAKLDRNAAQNLAHIGRELELSGEQSHENAVERQLQREESERQRRAIERQNRRAIEGKV